MNYGREIDSRWQILSKNWADSDSRSLRGAVDVLFFLLELLLVPTWESIIPCTAHANSLLRPTWAEKFAKPVNPTRYGELNRVTSLIRASAASNWSSRTLSWWVLKAVQ